MYGLVSLSLARERHNCVNRIRPMQVLAEEAMAGGRTSPIVQKLKAEQRAEPSYSDHGYDQFTLL
jgi:hypothetical protein